MIHGEQSWLGAELFGRSIVGEIWRKLSTKWRIGAENWTKTQYRALLLYPALPCPTALPCTTLLCTLHYCSCSTQIHLQLLLAPS